MIGLKMLEQGGVPKGLLEILLVISKSNEDAKTRAKAKKLLFIHGPSSWSSLLENKLLFKNINKKVREQELKNKLKKLESDTSFESAALLSTLLFKQYGKGLRFLVLNKSSTKEWKKKVFDLLVSDGHFNFSKGLGFKNWKGVPKEELTLFPYKMKFAFPTEILNYHKIESINLHNTKLTGFPKGLEKFIDLKR